MTAEQRARVWWALEQRRRQRPGARDRALVAVVALAFVLAACWWRCGS